MTQSNQDPNGHDAGGMPDDAGNGTTKQKVKDDARQVKREAGAAAREQAEAGQRKVTEEAGTLSDAIDAAASSLDDHDREGLARYARELSSNLANAAGQLEGRSVDELASDAKRLARDNPALFMLGSIAVGFGMSRFFKASSERNHDEVQAPSRADGQPEKGPLPGDDMSAGTPAHRREGATTGSIAPSTGSHNGDGRNMP